jgi:hypothetical protein
VVGMMFLMWMTMMFLMMMLLMMMMIMAVMTPTISPFLLLCQDSVRSCVLVSERLDGGFVAGESE